MGPYADGSFGQVRDERGTMEDDRITVFLADDHVMVREALAALLSANEDIQVVGQCGDGREVLDQVRALRPDVVLLDITMPGRNGLEVCRLLSRKAKKSTVLILTMHDVEEILATALRYGAVGCLLKEAAADQLAEAVRTVARGEVYLGPGIPKGVLRRMYTERHDPYELLTTRERQVFQLVAEGKTNRDIAKELDLAVKTIDSHRANLMKKLGIHDQTGLVKYALRKGIVVLG